MGEEILLAGKVTIITGAAQGIGRSIANLFAYEGSDLVLSDIDINKTEKTAIKIEKDTKRKVLALKVDVSNKSEVEEMVKIALNKFGKIDILVNNAGLLKVIPFLEFSEEAWDKIIDVNLKGAFLCSQVIAKEMIKKSSGKIINISSCAAVQPDPGLVAYGPSKAGILALTRNTALELGKYGINVNAILPGMTDTEMTRPTILNSETEADWIKKTALKRLGKPEDQAKVALFLASNLSDHVTGESIIVSAGETMR
jgi:NAD(P)-dependent dehydrogenase (short-subunit alcohol dehydrogenase family)